jgi:hypothetical protein
MIWRSQGHLNFIRREKLHGKRKCSIALPRSLSDVAITGDAYSNALMFAYGSGAGMGQKPDDWRVVPLCREHHTQQHTVGEQTFWNGVDIEALIEAFCKASPKAREIKEAQDK